MIQIQAKPQIFSKKYRAKSTIVWKYILIFFKFENDFLKIQISPNTQIFSYMCVVYCEKTLIMSFK